MTDPRNEIKLPASLANLKLEAIEKPIAVAPADSPATPTTPRPAFPDGPEPSRIYGYVAFVDPTTGTKWIPKVPDHPTADFAQSGVMTVRFVNPAGQTLDYRHQELMYVARTADGTNQLVSVNNGGFAWCYDIELHPDLSEGSPRSGHTSSYGHGDAIYYNSDQWRFLEVASVDDAWVGPPGTPTIPFTRRSQPFPDLPDWLNPWLAPGEPHP
jgi:hypothetical protein